MATEYAKTGGDDLDDGLELDPDLVASDVGSDAGSDAGSDGASAAGDGAASDGEGSAGAFLSQDEDAGGPVPGAARKRKAGDEERAEGASAGEGEAGAAAGEDTKAARKRRRKEKERARKALRLEREQAAVADPARMQPDELAALLLRSVRETFPAASAMEIDDVVIPSSSLLAPLASDPASSSGAPPTDTDALRARLADQCAPAPGRGKKLAPGTPRVVVLCLSGVRCADVVRAARAVETGGEVAKLFAKHFKLADQAKYLAHAKVAVAVGTPGRVAALLEQGALKVNSHTAVLLDIGHRDSKTRTLLTLSDVRDELWRKLFSGPARAALLGAGAKVGAV